MTNENSPRKIEFAPQDTVNAHKELTQDFVRRVLGLKGAWISDESTLWDFRAGANDDELISRIKQVYGIDVSDIQTGNISEILTRIAAAR